LGGATAGGDGGTRARSADTRATIAFGGLHVDLVGGRLMRRKEPVALRPKTWSVFRYLVERPGVLIPAEELLEAVALLKLCWSSAVMAVDQVSGGSTG
jgi:DNA-binding response OmpR family regulator